MAVTSGVLIQQTLAIWRRNFAPVTALMVIANVPGIVVVGASLATLDKDDPTGWGSHLTTYGLAGVAVSLFVGAWASGAAAYGIIQDLRGQQVPFGDWLAKGLQFLPKVLVVALLQGLVYALGFLLLLVPGFMAMAAFTAAPVVAVVEKLEGTAALKRSAELTSGARWATFGASLVLGLMVSLPTQFISRMMMSGQTSLDGVYDALIRSTLISEVVSVLLSGILSTLPAVAYHALRTQKEGVDVEDIARVFD